MGLYLEASILIAAGLCAITQGNVFTNALARNARFDPMHNECDAESSERMACGKFVDKLNEHQCGARGCCYDDRDRVEPGTIRCFLPKRMLAAQCDVDYKEKDDCGYTGISEGECVNIRKCCYRPSPRVNDPDCFNPKKDGEESSGDDYYWYNDDEGSRKSKRPRPGKNRSKKNNFGGQNRFKTPF